jgi:UDP-N-acetylglucosamine 2-epimerase (non-hydrolysing)
MSKIAIVLGTRPELIKCLPLLTSSSRYVPVFVEQHKDLLSTYFTKESHTIPIIEYGKDRLNNIISSILHAPVFDISWAAIMVQGDTAVAYAAALAGFHRKIQIIHLEAGLRTYNNDHPWPEEGYRKMIDAISSIALCPSSFSADNLDREGFKGQIQIVGNTSIDAIAAYNLVPTVGNKVLITLHRRENWFQIKEFFEIIEQIAQSHPHLEFILPIHPNPAIRCLSTVFKAVRVIEPLPHKELCELLSMCNCVISDSGGIQEEAAYLGKVVFCCRVISERREIENSHLIYTSSPQELLEKFTEQTHLRPRSDVYGNGYAYLKINSIIEFIYG